MLRWRIYYGDGSTYSDQDGPPELAPSFGAQVVVQMEPTRILIHGGMKGALPDGRMIDPARKDYFCYNLANEGDLWTLTDYIGFIDYLALPGWRKVVFGRTIEIPKFYEIIKRAIADPDFPAPDR